MLLWAGNCLEVSAEGDKAKLQDVRACSEAKGVPVVLVEDTKRLGEWVGVRRSLSVTPVLPHSMAHITRMDGRMLCRPVLVPDDALGHSPDSPLCIEAGWVPLQLGKIGRRRASTCLLAVVLDTESGDEAPALAALLRTLPTVRICAASWAVPL